MTWHLVSWSETGRDNAAGSNRRGHIQHSTDNRVLRKACPYPGAEGLADHLIVMEDTVPALPNTFWLHAVEPDRIATFKEDDHITIPDQANNGVHT